MSRTDARMRKLAERLIERESAASVLRGGEASTAFAVCEKLRPHLAALMGVGGFHALLARALALAIEEVPWLRAARVSADGFIDGAAEFRAQMDAKKFASDSTVLLARLLGLLAGFIGENLLLRVLDGVWPRPSPGGLDSEGETQNEDKT